MRSAPFVVALALISPAALAADDELVLAFEPSYALLTAETDLHGAGGHLTLAYGITDALWLTASFGGSRQLGRQETEGRTLLEGFGGLTLALDVLRTIPFVEVLIGVIGANVAGQNEVVPTVRLGAGFDFLLSPSVSLGAVFRYRPVTDELGDSYLTVDLRLAWRLEL